MPLQLTWADIGLRLLLTLIAGVMLGFNREAHGHAAGLRTTILVALAASLAMIETVILLPLDGKTPASFSVIDPMRLPLGVLTGVGFLGGGAILKRSDSITGVTTAATLWIATVIGLCLGGGQLGLGSAATALGIVTLWAMKWVDLRVPREQGARLVIRSGSSTRQREIERALAPLGYRVRLRKQDRLTEAPAGQDIETHYDLTWRQAETETPRMDFIAAIAPLGRIESFAFVTGDH